MEIFLFSQIILESISEQICSTFFVTFILKSTESREIYISWTEVVPHICGILHCFARLTLSSLLFMFVSNREMCLTNSPTETQARFHTSKTSATSFDTLFFLTSANRKFCTVDMKIAWPFFFPFPCFLIQSTNKNVHMVVLKSAWQAQFRLYFTTLLSFVQVLAVAELI